MSRFVKRGLAAVGGLCVALTAFIGFAHTKPGRPLLALLPGAKAKGGGSCPLGYDAARTPQQKEDAIRRFAVSHAGDTRAAARPAVGFSLDTTTRADVDVWAKAHGVTCKKPRTGADLDCSDVPDDALPEAYRGAHVASLWLNFGAEDKLASVIVIRRAPTAESISAAFATVTTAVTHEAGPATAMDADASPKRLQSGLLQQASAEYRFRNYYAVARATNMGDGFALTEEYRALPD